MDASLASFRGSFRARCYSPGGRLLWASSIGNGPTLEGLAYVMAAAFTGGAQLSSWYAGLIDNTSFTALATSDTMGSHAGWAESTAYSEGTRPFWTNLTSGNGVASNQSPMAFTITAAGTLRGLFLASNATKGGSSGTLWATALFTLPKVVAIGSSLNVTYINRLAGGT